MGLREVRYDDLDHADETDEDPVMTVGFGVMQSSFTVDITRKNLRKLIEALAPFIAVGTSHAPWSGFAPELQEALIEAGFHEPPQDDDEPDTELATEPGPIPTSADVVLDEDTSIADEVNQTEPDEDEDTEPAPAPEVSRDPITNRASSDDKPDNDELVKARTWLKSKGILRPPPRLSNKMIEAYRAKDIGLVG
jgi:hypothetical protein